MSSFFRCYLPELSQRIVHWLLVELVGAHVHYDGRVHKVRHPVGSALHVKSQVPINPTNRPIHEVLQQKINYREKEKVFNRN